MSRAACGLLLSLLAIACSTKKGIRAEDEAVTPGHYGVTSKSKKLVVEQGDVVAYEALQIAYSETLFPEEFLGYAMLMANKYEYPQAYYDVYEYLTGAGFYRDDIEEIDNNTANAAMAYLLKAYELGHHQAVEVVEDYEMRYDEATNRQQIIRRFAE